MKNNIIILLSFLFTLSCLKDKNKKVFQSYKSHLQQNKNVSGMQFSSDFQFSFKLGNDFYESKSGLFTRSYQSKKETIVIKLSENDEKEIYKMCKDIIKENLPNEINCYDQYSTMTQKFILEFTNNNKKKSYVIYADVSPNSNYKNCIIKNNVYKTIEKIEEIINKKKELKNLKQSDIYLE